MTNGHREGPATSVRNTTVACSALINVDGRTDMQGRRYGVGGQACTDAVIPGIRHHDLVIHMRPRVQICEIHDVPLTRQRKLPPSANERIVWCSF